VYCLTNDWNITKHVAVKHQEHPAKQQVTATAALDKVVRSVSLHSIHFKLSLGSTFREQLSQCLDWECHFSLSPCIAARSQESCSRPENCCFKTGIVQDRVPVGVHDRDLQPLTRVGADFTLLVSNVGFQTSLKYQRCFI
jgi:hypothetical protein